MQPVLKDVKDAKRWRMGNTRSALEYRRKNEYLSTQLNIIEAYRNTHLSDQYHSNSCSDLLLLLVYIKPIYYFSISECPRTLIPCS